MYIIYDHELQKYIALDESSGGYPYGTHWFNAKFWDTIDKARDYKKIIGKTHWEIHHVELKTYGVYR